MISLSAQLRVLSKLCQETLGQFSLALSKDHLEEMLNRYLVPQLTSREVQQRDQVDIVSSQKIKIAFPAIKSSDTKKLCHCHNNKFVYQFLECPQCMANLCLPSEGADSDSLDHDFCKFCGILFVQSSKHMRQSQSLSQMAATYRSLQGVDSSQLRELQVKNLNVFRKMLREDKGGPQGQAGSAESALACNGCSKSLPALFRDNKVNTKEID